MLVKRLRRRFDRDRRRKLDRIAVRAGRDRGKRDGCAPELGRQLDRAPVARREQPRLPCIAAAPDRADGVQHIARRQVAAAGRLHVPGVAAAKRAALREDPGAAGAVDRSVDTAAAEQRRVRRVDDGVDVLRGDVAEDELDHAYARRAKRTGRSAGSGINPLANAFVRYRLASPAHSP